MSQVTAPPAPQNIIIVRRLHPEDDGHHGGAWKIAFADFMTAMMAFFLVMWLTSVSDEAKKKAIAQYFNPIQLNSSSPDASGLDNGDAPASSKPPPPALGEVKDGGSAESKPLSGVATGGEEQALFRDPYAVLAEIAAEGGPGIRADGVQGVPDGSGLPGLNGGEAYRDPFDPSSWQLEPNAVASAAPGQKPEPAEFATKTEVAPPPAAPKLDAAKLDAAKPNAKTATPAPAPAVPGQLSAAAQSLAQEIKRQVQATDPKAASGVQVSEGEGGITISLADNVTSGMFEIGSAKPRAETIRMMEGIAKILSERKGDISIRGYTDARPYAGQEYDNWRLSTSRAHMAYYMLSRGGLAEDRVDSIEGYGDRKLKDPKDPFGAVNRRIEIILKEPAQ